MIPKREAATRNGQTYFVTSNTAGRKPFFRHARWADLLIELFYGYRPERFLLHGFVVMPDHFHLLMTPQESLERAVQCIKGGFSFRAKKELGWTGRRAARLKPRPFKATTMIFEATVSHVQAKVTVFRAKVVIFRAMVEWRTVQPFRV